MLIRLLVVIALGCGSGTREVPSAQRGALRQQRAQTPLRPTRADERPILEGRAESPAPGEVRRPEVPVVPVVNLHEANRFRFTHRSGATWNELGTPTGSQHSLGGWTTSLRRRVLTLGEESVPALVSTGRTGRFVFSYDETMPLGEDGLTFRFFGRSVRGGPVAAYLGERELRVEGELPSEGRGQIQVTIPRELLSLGEHEITLRARRSGQLPGVGRAGLILEAALIGEGEPPADTRRTETGFQVDSNWGIARGFAVPEGARFRAEASSPVTLELLRDGESPIRHELEAGRLDVSLRELAGAFVEARIFAREGSAEVNAPSIVIPAPRNVDSAPEIKNVMVVLIDTLRADRLAPYSPQTRVQTPGLMNFVESASTFLHAHSQENWTKPSVATLLSGLMPWEHRATEHASVVPRSVTLLPQRLSEAGFETASFICNGFVSDRFGFDRGWNAYRNYIREGRRTHAEAVASDVLSWLDSRDDQEKPFFLYVHTIDPHVPYRPPRRFLEMYGDSNYSGRVNFSRDATLLENVKLGNLRLNDRDRSHLEALYDGEITYHDVHFQAILDGLRNRGAYDNTLIIVTSDHGEEFWDHGSVGHGHSVYEELLHVPFFAHLPGVPARRVQTPVGLVDVVPTVLEALGQDVPDELSGRSFLSALRGGDEMMERETISGFMDNWRTLTAGRYKLVRRSRSRVAIYDLEEDPGETTDLSESRPLLGGWLRRFMGIHLDASEAARQGNRRHRQQNTQIDPETAAQLRALGYVE